MPKSPAYQRIKSAILTSIHQGKWVVGQAIPTEMALAEQFGVSRMTVNRALKELTDEQVLVRVQGSGTFVAQKQFHHTFIEIRNIAKDITSSGRAYRAQVLCNQTLSFEELPTFVAHIFYKQPQNVHWVKIVHFADNIPLQLEERWVSANLVPDFNKQNFSQISTSEYLLATVALESGHYQIKAEINPNSASILGVPPSEALLVLERTTFAYAKVVTFVKMSHIGSYAFLGSL